MKSAPAGYEENHLKMCGLAGSVFFLLRKM
jgi:hypothetical protein